MSNQPNIDLTNPENLDMGDIARLIAALPASEQKQFNNMLARMEEAQTKRLAKAGFLDFVKYVWPNFIAGNHHKIMAAAFDRVVSGACKRLIICMPPRHTKALALNTPILTPTGWSTMANLQVGGFVYGTDGMPTKIIGKSEVFRDRPCWLATTDDKDCGAGGVICDDDHLWTIFRDKWAAEMVTETARDIAVRQIGLGGSFVGYRHIPRLPLAESPWVASRDWLDGCPDPAKARLLYLRRAPNHDTVCIKVEAKNGLFLAGRDLMPTHNSEFASIHFPSFFLGHHPDKKVIMASHTSELSVGFGRKVRNLISGPEYQGLFPGTTIAADNKAAGRWGTSKGGELFAIGVGGMMSGRGADLLVIDDAHSEGQGALAMTNPEVMEPTVDWYESGPRQRLQPGGAIVLVGTRWHANDLIGTVIDRAAKNPNGQQWEIIEFPAILPSGRSLWPQYWPLPELEAIRAEIPAFKWNAQYLQRPGGSEVAMIKRDYWQHWTKDDPPEIEIVISCFDTAFTKEKRSNYSACVVMGVFYRTLVRANGDEEEIPNVILLDAWKKRLDFPDLKRELLAHYKERRPDIFLIENRATGSPLIQEFREMGLVVSEFTPSNKMGKVARVNAVLDVFASNRVWAPDMPWAEDVIQQCETFPFGAEDDFVDCISMGLLRLREGNLVTTNRDLAAIPEDEREFKKRRRVAGYY